MSMSWIIGFVVFAVGVVLLGFAYHSTNAPMEELSNKLTGRYSNRRCGISPEELPLSSGVACSPHSEAESDASVATQSS